MRASSGPAAGARVVAGTASCGVLPSWPDRAASAPAVSGSRPLAASRHPGGVR
ncbi:hypothetical protein ACFSM7_04145 [Clavibacter michiganensis subsp. tessellarius]|uniref:hypothetical protein n=1 Tax=Clavibacter tessellarius TaxID=31965 RepID=UPI0036436E05